MKKVNLLRGLVCAIAVVVGGQLTAIGQSIEDKNRLAVLSGSGTSVRWEVIPSYSALTLTISAPDGRIFRKEFKTGASVDFLTVDRLGERLPDGQYSYELRLTPVFSSATKETLAAERGKDDEPEEARAARKRALPTQNLVQSGAFSILNGSVIVAGAVEQTTGQSISKISERPQPRYTSSSSTLRQRNHFSKLAYFDQVIPDDLIVQGSACVGLDCVNNENFGFDTLRLKENNLRIHFDDTSTQPGFPSNNWQLIANDSASGGASFFGIVDQGATGNLNNIIAQFDAGAPANSLRLSSTGRLGVRTATPVLDVHINNSDTPAIRLEQNNTGGFTAQTWDVAGNEANFFVRDVTSGSRLPLRIRPGAPTSSIDIAASGNVGIGTSNPSLARLVVVGGNDAGSSNGIHISSTEGLESEFGFFSASASNDYLRLGYWNGSQLRTVFMDVGVTGRVGIGTSTPDQTLSVNGGASKVGGGSWSVFSDERLKKIKGNFNTGINAIMQLQPLRFEYLPNNALGLKSEGQYVGFGAQALRKVIPEAVSTSSNGYLQVNNDPILWTMLNAIKEQQNEIEQLKKEIRKLRASSRRRR